MRQGRVREIVEDIINEKDSDAIIGKVTKVYAKESTDLEEGNIEVNAQTRSGGNEMREIPVMAFDHTGHVSVPQVGDFVLIEELRGRGNTPYATDIVYTNKRRSPLGRPGHWRHEFGAPDSDEFVYLEAEKADQGAGDPDLVRMGVKEDGLSEPSTEIAVDNSGDTARIRIETDGDIELNAGGDIIVDGTTLEDHEHDYDWTDSGGSSTTGPMK